MQAYLAPIGLCVARSEIRSSRRSTLEPVAIVLVLVTASRWPLNLCATYVFFSCDNQIVSWSAAYREAYDSAFTENSLPFNSAISAV